MSDLYQCPYCPATKCVMTEPCNGCETWSEAGCTTFNADIEALKQKLMDEIDAMPEFSACGWVLLISREAKVDIKFFIEQVFKGVL